MASVNPVAVLVDAALNHVRTADPTWDAYQPQAFRERAVESWKKHIRTQIENRRLRWTMKLGATEFYFDCGLFTRYDFHYNPYRQ
jgi:hypothetical protein